MIRAVRARRAALLFLLVSAPASGTTGDGGAFTPLDLDPLVAVPLPADFFNELGAPEGAPDGVDAAPVELELVADRAVIRPGEPFDVALRLRHAAGYYSYWENPGESGEPARAAWILPPGFSVDAPRWPAPRRYAVAGFVSYVLDGDTAAFYRVTLPAALVPGQTVTLKAAVAALVCRDACVPVTRELTLDLRVAGPSADPAASPFADAPDLAALHAALPVPPEAWRFAARRVGKEIVVDLLAGDGANPDPGDVRFFESARDGAWIGLHAEPALERTDDGFRLTLAVGDAASASVDSPPPLRGVLVASRGWLRGGDGPRAFLLDLPVVEGGDAGARRVGDGLGSGGAWAWVFAFLGGLILNVMPCVFPVLGLKVMSMVRHAHQERRPAAAHAVAYAGGVLVCFWIVAGVAIALGRAWGAQLQSPVFVLVIACVFLALALNMAGVFEVGALDVGAAGEKAAHQTGVRSSFLTGVLATLTSTPCSAPFLGSALTYALSRPVPAALSVFTVMALGFAAPYVLLTLFPACLRLLPRPGRWMETLRRAMSFTLFGAVAFMVWVYAGLVDEGGLLAMLFGLVAVAFGFWCYGHGQEHPHARKRLPAYTLAAVFAVFLGLWWGWPREKAIRWEEWSPERVATLRAQGRPVYIDFTARWCMTCQVNKRVYNDPAVIRLFADRNVATLRADWTDHDPSITKTLRERYNKAAVPVNVVYRPDADAPDILPELLTAARVAAALDDSTP